MTYSIKELADLSGVSTRTLRYYDEIGLLTPKREESNLYRVYGEEEVDRLQQILFYRELDVSLEDIQLLLSSPDFDRKSVLQEHLLALLRKKSQLEQLIHNLNSTIAAMEGEITMTDTEKFEGFKKELIASNERKYGAEVQQKYGEESVEKTNQRISGLSEVQWEQAKALEARYLDLLKAAEAKADPSCDEAKEACRLHKEWLLHFWTPEMYSPQAHIGLVEMYGSDERFQKYYEGISPSFFLEAVKRFYQVCE